MSKQKFITKDAHETVSQQYDELLRQGILYIQKFSGDQWTDYNYHDPGITILEQLCFAITDLGYKSNFPIEDVLFLGRDKFDHKKSNLFYRPSEILPSAPLTINDLRKLIIDQIDEVDNAWVYPDKDNKLNIQGLFKINLQLSDHVVLEHEKKIVQKVHNLLLKNRSLGTDFSQILPLKKEEIKFGCQISLDSFAVGEQVLAEVMIGVENLLSNHLDFLAYKELEEELEVSHLYTGTFTQKGFLKEKDMKDKKTEIYLSELKEIIYNTPGVNAIENLVVYKNGIQIHQDFIAFDTHCYPSLEKADFMDFDQVYQLTFLRNGTVYNIDKIIFQQIYDALIAQNRSSYQKEFKEEEKYTLGRFTQKEFEKYYSIVNEFPAVYGLKSKELASKSSDLRKAQVQQLRAYLFLFDQIMANHISQLTHLRDILSINIDDQKSFYFQIPKDYPQLHKIFINKNQSQYLESLNQALETNNEYYSKKNAILDHLLARFGENFDTTILKKTKKSTQENISDKEINDYALITKVNYIKQLKPLGYEKNIGFDYTQLREDEKNLSGIEKRLKLKLAINKNISDSAFLPLASLGQITKTNNSWKKKSIKIDKKKTANVLALDEKEYGDNQVHFYLPHENAIKNLFRLGGQSKNYKIIHQEEKSSILFLNGDNKLKWTKIFHSTSKESCTQKIKEILKKFLFLNEYSESFTLVESILLRPVAKKKHELIIYDQEQKPFFTSWYDGEFAEMRILQSDFLILASDKKNFNVFKNKNKAFEILLYDLSNKIVLKSVKKYKEETSAKLQIPLIVQYFKSLNSKNDQKQLSEIKIKNDLSNDFPEEFNFSNHLYFVFPNWPIRFQNKEIKNYIEELIKEFIPVHMSPNILYLELNEMQNFENLYQRWLDQKNKGEHEKVDQATLPLVQLLLEMKKKYGK